ncbi:MAG TPA: hypothetical protein VFE58_16675 [Tepidisphaeraceae bacterium]|jgi:hypothetical protein|nr:hypothetical protein [Tepidisphaeraceae bacterium]
MKIQIALILLSLTTLSFAADPAPVHISGVGISTPSDWTPDRIKSDLAADTKTIEYSSHGQAHHATAVSLLALLKASGLDTTLKHDPAADPHKKHAPLHYAVTVTGTDGYSATFALAELLPDAGNHDAYLALDSDDKPLPPSDGPTKLIVPSDAKPSRWVHSVGSITIFDCAPAK